MVSYNDIYVDIGADYASVIKLFTLAYDDYDFFGDIKKSYTSATIASLTFAPVVNQDNKAKIAMSSTVTKDLKAGRYYYDIFARNIESQEIQKIREGQVIVSPAVTIITTPAE